MSQLIVFGRASGKIIKTIDVGENVDTNLMEFLRSHGVPVASSCYGMGVCEKCVINDSMLSCMITVSQYLTNYPNIQIQISYL